MTKKDLKQIEKIVKDFFEKMRFGVGIKIGELQENTLPMELNSEEANVLIGYKGRTLAMIQKLLGRIIRRQTGEQIFVDLDINQYKKKKEAFLRELAQASADRVSLEGREKALTPMSSYERRIIHMALSGRQDVQTESLGEGPGRRVIIKPI